MLNLSKIRPTALKTCAFQKPALSLRNNYGISLTELILSTILLGIVMLTSGAFLITIKDIQNSTSRAAAAALRVTGAMTQIQRDANLAVGDLQDEGFYPWLNQPIALNLALTKRLCFRQEQAGGDPTDYTDDQWVCYSEDIAEAEGKIYRCANMTHPENDPCDSGTNDWKVLTLPTVAPLPFPDPPGFFEIIDEDLDGGLDQINLNLASRFDSTDAEDPIKNPEFVIQTRVSPSGHSR